MPLDSCVFASRNAGKLKEVAAFLQPIGMTVHAQPQDIKSAEETGLTFVENALIKARHVAQHVGSPVLADDSGLVVPALGGQPGIYSARYAGQQASSEANMHQLLRAMESLAGTESQAYFYCTLVLLRTVDDPTPIIASAQWSGEILRHQSGVDGFGYDPVFQPAGYEVSAACLGLKLKNQISHRALALQQLVAVL